MNGATVRDRLVRRYYDRPGTVDEIAAEEFPDALPADVAAARRHVDAQCGTWTYSRAEQVAIEHLRDERSWTYKVLSPCCRRPSRSIGNGLRQCRKCKDCYPTVEVQP